MEKIRWGLIKVLVAEDSPVDAEMLKSFIKKTGCIAEYVENGQEALDVLRKYNFDICFMDLMMPVMGGIEAAQIIRDEISTVLPIIAITSSTMKADRQKCQDVGMNNYIQKPFSMKDIKGAIEAYGLKS